MVIIVKEESAGNDTVGSMWLEAKSFPLSATLAEVLEWKSARHGKLIITQPQTSEKEVESHE